ncbi:hypothetical protein PMAYCL1PPCAC_03847, partial [Pristionchus mayeri]
KSPENSNGSVQISAMDKLSVDPSQIWNSRLTSDFAYCEILVNYAKPILSLETGRFRLSFVTKSHLKMDSFEPSKKLGKIDERRRCNPFSRVFKNETYEGGTFIKLEVKDILSPEIECSDVHPKSELYAVLAASPSAKPVPVRSVQCISRANLATNKGEWVYEILEGLTSHEIEPNTNFEVFCRVPVSLMCKDLPGNKTTSSPKFEQNFNTMQVSLKCPDKWLINKISK